MIQLERRFDVQLISHESLAGYMAFRGHTVRTLAKQVGVSHALIGFLRSGHRRSCSPRTARAIAAALNCPVEALFVPRVSTVARETAPSPRKAA